MWKSIFRGLSCCLIVLNRTPEATSLYESRSLGKMDETQHFKRGTLEKLSECRGITWVPSNPPKAGGTALVPSAKSQPFRVSPLGTSDGFRLTVEPWGESVASLSSAVLGSYNALQPQPRAKGHRVPHPVSSWEERAIRKSSNPACGSAKRSPKL